jgi:nucleotide-binding universal stress UspA family protein
LIDDVTGNIVMQRVLIPVESAEFYFPAYEILRKLVTLFPGLTVEVTLLHVGTTFPAIQSIAHPQLIWKELLQPGSVVETICTCSETMQCDLVIMATNGRDTIPRKIVGSTTEHVLSGIYCPVLSVALGGK